MPMLLSGADWAAALVFVPLLAALVSFLLPRSANWLGCLAAALILLATLGLVQSLLSDGPLRLAIGGWGAPLGIDLWADGLSAALLLMTALVGLGVSVYALAYFAEHPEQRRWFWPLWLLLWTALNGLYLSADLFNLYVMLEVLGLSAAALTALSGSATALNAAMRYLFVSLLGSAAYLLGVTLLYHGEGTLDIALLGERIEAGTLVYSAALAMATGLLLKTALFPFHFWLPPAHGSAPAPVSALLSALVIKASFYLLLRLWLELFSGLAGPVSLLLPELLGLLGVAAVLWGSVQALRQRQLKWLIAYSTVAQIGYLFLAFPLAGDAIDRTSAMTKVAWQAALYLALAHGLAKAAMFLSTGSLLRFAGHDRIADLDRAVQRLPLTLTAFVLGGISIMGLPPSGGFIGKWLLLEAAFSQGRWGLALVVLLGGVLAAGYVFKVVGYAFTPTKIAQEGESVPAAMQWSALLLAFGAILLGFAAPWVWPLLEVGAQ
ncbi:MAG: proton-conducting transporter membrane subunit [Lamprobacter sp.]|uniref:complex I subunit 5 family protein n=1 Tax=Lamprobacter sp. TaxID=3100796 RepID=UPI002B25DBE1|nr:proton-conducting transporter membrane subunit [Lamprobacter sp.]MEA3638869.1 proton-conducting transporter membrane subunit [Lamprobacter sp.]